MVGITDRQWASIERWSPRLFLLGAVLELVFALNNGLAYLLDGLSFVEWLYPTVLIGRGAVLLGIVGLSVRVADRDSRAGTVTRAVVAVAIIFTAGLLSLSILQIAGVTTPIIAIFGLGTVATTIITYALVGAVILHTGAYATPIGGALLVAAATVLGVFVGLTVLPTRVVGAVGEGALVVIFLAVWHVLTTERGGTDGPEPDREPVGE